MIEARKNHGLVFVKDRIFAIGGQNGLGMISNCLAILWRIVMNLVDLLFSVR